MKTVLTFFILFASIGAVGAQTQNCYFISHQRQQVKYDSLNKLYFIDREINDVSRITIENNIISFVTADSNKNSVIINNFNLDSLNNKLSFTLNGRDAQSGEQVKLGFWFIDGVLDEVSYAGKSIHHAIAYKDISDMEVAKPNSPQKSIASAIHSGR